MSALRHVSEFGELRLVGGEPLLNPDIDDYLAAARNAGIARVYGVITNGILLNRMTDRFFQLIDYVRVSAYPVTSPKRNELRKLLEGRSRQFHFKYIIRETEHFYDIETPELSEADAQKSFAGCRRRLDFPLIHSGYFYKCMRPPTTHEYLVNRGTCESAPDFARVDGVSLDSPQLLENLRNYMADRNALKSCRFCLLGFFDAYQNSRYSRLKKSLGRLSSLRRAIHDSPVASSLVQTLNSSLLSKSENRVPMQRHSIMTSQECRPAELVTIRTPRRA